MICALSGYSFFPDGLKEKKKKKKKKKREIADVVVFSV